jgi:3-hydroxyisobutyrate dehydrogenase
MARIAFIGLGNMGGPMARNLLKAGHALHVFDIAKDKLDDAVRDGAKAAKSPADAAAGAEIVLTMLPAGQHVRAIYAGANGVIAAADKSALLIDCSTVDVASARAVSGEAGKAGLEMLDAPVSGGVAGAAAGMLTFMVGGSEAAFARAEPVLRQMGKTVVHAGAAGAGQAAKICNNMILGVSMIAVSEAFALAKRLGLDAKKLFEVSSKSSGQCWSLTTYCPEPGLVETAPSNRDYKPGFTAAMMLKDLRLAQEAASAAGAATPLGAEAAALYALYCNAGHAESDFSGIIRMMKGAQ